MVNMIIKFAACCRASGLLVSTSEVLDAVSHIKLISVTDENLFKAALKTNFVKSRRDQGLFDRLYAFFFHEINLDVENMEAEQIQDNGFEKQMADIIENLRDREGEDDIDRAIIDFLSGDPISYLDHITRIRTSEKTNSQVLKSNMDSLSKRLSVMIKLNRMKERVMGPLPDAEEGDGQRLGVRKHIDKRLETARAMLSEDPRPENESIKQVKSKDRGDQSLGEQPFTSFSQEEIEKMRHVIDHLARKLKDIVSRRFRARRKGVIDVKKTLRRAGRYQGIPIEIIFKQRSPRKGKIVVFCDVSGSVWSSARYMLNMLYSLHECFNQIKSFVFVSALMDVTEVFEKNKIDEAIKKVMTHEQIRHQELTDYGETLLQFKKDHMHVLTKKTTLIILGDGRSNYMNPREKILAEMRDKCRRLIWLNPEPERFWYTGDSEMSKYKAYCHEIRPCRNLNQLMEFIEELVL
ncbi:VWA domain-containing protein [Desulfobacterales bacterium HSG16]|nr:VWA domain-containing protein [Desulfobacterales bacterium HSG16]